MGTGLISLVTGPIVGLYEHGNEPSGAAKA
jgi:hypothetical protein